MKRIGFLIVCFLMLWLQIISAEHINISELGTIGAETIPPRSRFAINGSEFARRTDGMSDRDRQQAALEELRKGNIPQFLRNLKPVRLSQTLVSGETMTAIIWVMPDYLAIGSDEDFLRIPLAYPSAATFAKEFGFVLPTKKMVDAIYAQSAFHLKPQPMPPGPQMRSNYYFLKHQQRIEAQRTQCPLGELISGHKKDVVLTNLLRRRPGRIAIYGWHRQNGEPIQPLSIVHGAWYADYSHGIRLVIDQVWINGKMLPILDVLNDPVLAPLLTYEGVIPDPRSLLSLKQ